MQISVSTPNRIDLAGGTTDIYPLYLILEGGCTVNVAVNIRSRVMLSTPCDDMFSIVSEDMGESVTAPYVSDLRPDGPLGLVCRAVRAVPPPGPIEVRTRNEAPVGSGIGASSALLTALLAGLGRLSGRVENLRSLISLAAGIETAAMGVPAGKQDYVSACYGGISVIDFGYKGFEGRRSPPADGTVAGLEQMMVLSYCGETRFSGQNNWEMVKRFIDGVDGVRDRLAAIRDVARETADVLLAGNLDELGPLVEREWNLRRELAPGISTPNVEAIILAAREAGATGGKVCGAGGGGCIVNIVPPHRKAAVEAAICEAGGTVMDFRLDPRGLDIVEMN
ncbi:MAG: GHMP kinase [Pseudomonadota bacterium]